MDYCLDNGIENVEEIDSHQIKRYFAECRKAGNGAGTITTRLLRIRAFLNYCVEGKMIGENPAKKIKRLIEDVQIDVFSDQQINQMLAYYRSLRHKEQSFSPYRGYMLVLIPLSTGVRRSELINLKWSHIEEGSLSATIYNGKGRIDSMVLFTEKLMKELLYYQSFCRNHFGKLSEYVLPKRDNTKMTALERL